MKGILSHTFQFMIFVAKISKTTRIILYVRTKAQDELTVF